MRVLALILFIIFMTNAFAAEKLGDLSIRDISIRPQLTASEPQSGGFSLGSSFVSFGYSIKPNYKAVLSVGQLSLINQSSYFFNVTDNQESQLGLFEVYAETAGLYGTFKMGLIPIEYGLNGGLSESKLFLPRTLLFKNRLVALRDYGLSYRVGFKKFYSQLSLHNGESAVNTDGRIWTTGKWAYKVDGLHVGLTGQFGETTIVSTALSSETRAGFNKIIKNNILLGGLFIESSSPDTKMYFEFHYGQIKSDTNIKGEYTASNFGVNYKWKKNIWFDTRFDAYDPDNKVEGNLYMETSLGVSFVSSYLNSVLSIVAIKKEEQLDELNNDELLITWKITP